MTKVGAPRKNKICHMEVKVLVLAVWYVKIVPTKTESNYILIYGKISTWICKYVLNYHLKWYVFLPKCITEWNRLPLTTINTPSVDTVKDRLKFTAATKVQMKTL